MIGIFKLLTPAMVKGIIKYVFEDNELDVNAKEMKNKVADLEKKLTDVAFKVTASVDMIKRYSESIDNVAEKVKSIDKVIDKFDDKLQQIGKIAHPPAIPLKDINELKESAKDVKWMMGLFKIMKKNPLLKSIFK